MPLSVNHPAAVRWFSAQLTQSMSQNTYIDKIGLLKPAGEGDKGAAIIRMDQMISPKANGKRSGYEVTYDLEGPALGLFTPGDKVVKGKEKKLTLFTDSLQINQDRVSYIDDGKFADGLVPFEFRNRVKERVATETWPTYQDERFVIKWSGAVGDGTWYTIDPSASVAGARDVEGSVSSDGNDLRAPSSNRIVYGNGKANQAAMTTSDGMTLSVVDQALMLALRPSKNSTNKRIVPPLNIGGKQCYVMLCDYVTLQAMYADTSGRFYDIQRAKIQGGMKDSQLLDYIQYVYQSPFGVDVYFVAHPNLVKFSASTTGSVQVVRNLMVGNGSLRIAYGQEAKGLPQFSWHEETDDRGNQLVVTTGTVVGIQKAAFNTTELGTTREDWATIAVDTYGAWQ